MRGGRRCPASRQFGVVAAAELGEAVRLVAVPAAQVGRGGDVAQPLVQMRVRLAHAPRPDPVHQHPRTVLGRGLLVDSAIADRTRPWRHLSLTGRPRAARAMWLPAVGRPPAGPARARRRTRRTTTWSRHTGRRPRRPRFPRGRRSPGGDSARAGRRGDDLPGLPAAGRLARGGRHGSSGRAFADWEYWARPVPGFGPPDAPLADRRAGPGRARRQPHRADVHRRPVRRRAVRGPATTRPGVPAHRHAPGRRPGAVRRTDHLARALRAARQPAHHHGARHLPPVAGPRAGAAAPDAAGRRRARRLRLAGAAARTGRRRLAVPRPRPAFGHGAHALLAGRRRRTRRCTSSAATTPASATSPPAP